MTAGVFSRRQTMKTFNEEDVAVYVRPQEN
jgi:hypothetical protein